MKFHGYLAGFSQTFDSLDALRAWANGLVAQYGLKGEKLKIHKAVKTFAVGKASAAIYSGKPSHYREIVIGE